MPRQSQVFAAHVLVAAVHRLTGSTNATLTPVDLVYKSFAILDADNNVVPESQQTRIQSGAVQCQTEIFNLRGLAGTIESGKADEQRAGSWFCTHEFLVLRSSNSARDFSERPVAVIPCYGSRHKRFQAQPLRRLWRQS